MLTAIPDLISVREAASQLRVSTATIWRWIRSGELPSYRVGPKRVMLAQKDVARTVRPSHSEPRKQQASASSSDLGLANHFQQSPGRPYLPSAWRLIEPDAAGVLRIPRLTPAEIRQAKAAVAASRKSLARQLKARGGVPYPDSIEDNRRTRDERGTPFV